MKSMSLNRMIISSSTFFALLLLTACGGGGGSSDDSIVNPEPPPVSPQPWIGPKRFLLTKPETGNNPIEVSISHVDGAVMLDGVERKFQARAVERGQLAFSAGVPWIENSYKTSRSMLASNGNRVNYIEYSDSQSLAEIGAGDSNSIVAVRDYIALCSPSQRYSLINADAKPLSSESLSLFANRTLRSPRHEFNACSGNSRYLNFDAEGGATISMGGSSESLLGAERFSAAQLQFMAHGNSMLMPDGVGMRSIVIYQFNDSSGSRLAIQEFASYPDARKNYIRIWY
ncbi:hypothetical protein [Iodobacter fluviatilis]|uniref:Uncharacterized protein n=2 Tax=Iodobacter fluviatilis TaxID=537 RepID=A0ABY2C2J6_9NEIS|nr:hypothetical protein [Iodobacter fluviatilis]TCU81183.1 hypothetical protein EV682_12614 [Iodobacter fluviatilis]